MYKKKDSIKNEKPIVVSNLTENTNNQQLKIQLTSLKVLRFKLADSSMFAAFDGKTSIIITMWNLITT